MKPTQNRFPIHSLLTLLLAIGICTQTFCMQSFAQEDAVYQLRESGGSSKISGKITNMTPYAVTIETSNGSKEIPAGEIAKISVGDEPLAVSRARSRIDDGRFDDALGELEKIGEPIDSPMAQQEVDYLKTYATARVALRGGGSITAKDAGSAVKGFVTKYPQSIHFYEATELLGKLLFAFGRPDLAESEFAKMAQSKSAALEMAGNFYRGETLNAQGKYPEAKAAYDVILGMAGTDDLTQEYKLLAKIQKAKTDALAGNGEAAIPVVEEIIKVENADKVRVFAYAYNALGTAHLQGGKFKEAATAFLHTDLLFATESEAHAEALYNLALIWPKLEKTDRANRARDGLKTTYRNSYWATKL